MNQLQKIAVAAVAVAALAATLGTASASATTIEVEGTKQSKSVDLNYRVSLGSSTVLKESFFETLNTCTESRIRAFTELPYTGTTVTGKVTLSFGGCQRAMTVHNSGTLHIEHISGTTNGTVTSSGAEFTTNSVFGYLNCKTGLGTHLGPLTGNAGGFSVFSTIHVNANLTCGGVFANWSGTYTSTWADGIGVTA